MSATAKALAKGATFEFEGEAYTLAPWTYDVQAEYEKHLQARAYANLRAARPEMGPGEYEEERAALRRDVDAGEYDFGRPLAMKSIGVDRNFKHLLYLCLAYGSKDRPGRVTRDLVERIAENVDKYAEAGELMAEVNRDPNPPAPSPGAPASAS
jgi:hypothetical protein